MAKEYICSHGKEEQGGRTIMTHEEAANILDPEIDIQYLFDFIREHYGKRGVDSSLLCECVDAEACRMGAAALRALDVTEKPKTPCDLCLYNPPSSGDGKPCTMCPASSLPEPPKEEHYAE